MSKIKNLPRKLNQLIDTALDCLYDVIRAQTDDAFFAYLWTVRMRMKRLSHLSERTKTKYLQNTYDEMGLLTSEDKQLLARGFTLMMEVVNACETSYRTHRICQKKQAFQIDNPKNILVFVLTAHPTEARSPANIALFQQVQQICLAMLEKPGCPILLAELKHVFHLAWFTPVARHKRPSVLDEAEYIFSTVLGKACFDELINFRLLGVDVRIRTWVGGDKDGHPGVDERVMIRVMTLARKQFITILDQKLMKISDDLFQFELKSEAIQSRIKSCRSCLKPLRKIVSKDYQNLQAFFQAFDHLKEKYHQLVGTPHPEINQIDAVRQVFPGLIVPIELREDAEQIHLSMKKFRLTAIRRMIRSLASICGKGPVESYVKGLIISMTESEKDIEAGLALLSAYPELKKLRVVPLFETESALNNASRIVESVFKHKSMRHHISQNWRDQFEIMLGYSDSSKGMGVLASRLAIAMSMRALDEVCRNHHIKPLFFHGSGGSIDRGGGSIQEQSAWWPQSSFQIYKTTLQGEMVERRLATREIFNDMVVKFLREAEKKHEILFKHQEHVQAFADMVSHYYQAKIEDKQFLNVVSQATSYRLLDKLKMGSRPAKRTKALSVHSLRAIPWVLCWTQTRTLFPTWWGVGSAWDNQLQNQKRVLQTAFHENPLFRSFVKLLGFSLAKVDLSIWQLYLSTSRLSHAVQQGVIADFRSEYQKACQMVFDLTEQSDLLWFRPWLNESITRRAALVHPLNILQIHAIRQKDEYLMRETTTGIAAGMLTTG